MPSHIKRSTPLAASTPPPPFGSALKDWRARRRLSQLDLALAAGVSARHVAFLETGRARPSREMVVALSAAMDVPLRNRNTLLTSAGFAPAYAERKLTDSVLAPVRAALDFMLTRHDPYPGILLDRHWNLVQANRAATLMFAPFLASRATANLVELLAANPLTEKLIVDWPAVARDFLARLRLEAAHAGDDPELERLIALLAAEPALAGPVPVRDQSANPFIGSRLRVGDTEIALFSTIAEFGTVEDITVRDLRLELFFPADPASDAVLRAASEKQHM